MNKKSFLIINPGSATLKWAQFFEDDFEHAVHSESIQSEVGVLANIESLVRSDVYNSAQVIIIRFVHGGDYFHKATLVDEAVLKILEGLIDLAPLHNQQSFMCASKIFKKFIENPSEKSHQKKLPKLIAVFDTEFFHDLPEVAKTYGLPFALQKKYHIRRYGFHGFAHHAMHKQLVDNFPEAKKIITLQLGSGCSMAAIDNHCVIDTTMGFTPSEGLLMSTRSGDLDPGLLLWLQKKEGWSTEQTLNMINQQSGWSGLSQLGKDFSVLLTSNAPEAKLAIALFIYRIRKQLGAYFAILGGIDAIAVSGGIAENSLATCCAIFSELEHLGIVVQTTDEHEKSVHDKNHSSKNSYLLSKSESQVAIQQCANGEYQSIFDSVNASGLLN